MKGGSSKQKELLCSLYVVLSINYIYRGEEMRKTLLQVVMMLIVLSLVLSACGGGAEAPAGDVDCKASADSEADGSM